jgi:hypothetical protein
LLLGQRDQYLLEERSGDGYYLIVSPAAKHPQSPGLHRAKMSGIVSMRINSPPYNGRNKTIRDAAVDLRQQKPIAGKVSRLQERTTIRLFSHSIHG